jgi:hypothetical protein
VKFVWSLHTRVALLLCLPASTTAVMPESACVTPKISPAPRQHRSNANTARSYASHHLQQSAWQQGRWFRTWGSMLGSASMSSGRTLLLHTSLTKRQNSAFTCTWFMAPAGERCGGRATAEFSVGKSRMWCGQQHDLMWAIAEFDSCGRLQPEAPCGCCLLSQCQGIEFTRRSHLRLLLCWASSSVTLLPPVDHPASAA